MLFEVQQRVELLSLLGHTDRQPAGLVERYLRVTPSGRVESDYVSWYVATERVSLPSREMAAAYDEWADFYEFRLEQQADELAEDHHKHGLMTEWTEDMAYCARRCAAFARGADPGEPVPLSVRRPDLYEARRARVAEIIAELPARGQAAIR